MYPALPGDLETLVRFVGMSDIDISGLVVDTANAKRPILAIDGLSTCIGFSGYNPDSRIGFLTHLLSSTPRENILDHLQNQLATMGILRQAIQHKFKGMIFVPPFADQWNVSDLMHKLQRSPYFHDCTRVDFQPVLRTVLGDAIALDLRDGKYYTFKRDID